MKNTADFYNKTVAGFSSEWLSEKRDSHIVEKFYNCFFNAGTVKPRVLNLGSGAGYEAKILTDLGASVVGIDISEKLVEVAKKNVKKAKFFVGDITNRMTSLGKFEGALCLATIMHIDIDKLRTTFQNISAVLKKGGLLLVSAFDGNGKNIEKSFVKIDGEQYDKDFNNYSSTSICASAYPTLKLVDTWIEPKDFEDGWRYYVFMKV